MGTGQVEDSLTHNRRGSTDLLIGGQNLHISCHPSIRDVERQEIGGSWGVLDKGECPGRDRWC